MTGISSDRNRCYARAIALTAETTLPLTQREQEILALIAASKSNQEIATTLYITPGTVRVHFHTIIQKLGVRDRTQAAVLAIQQKWIAGG